MFGYPFLEQAIQGWGARAIFKPNSDFPLDLLPDRQGSKGLESESEWNKFQSILNREVLPELRKLVNGFTQDSHEVLCKHFPWAYDDNLILVAQGSPNGSYGYFYMAVNLVRKEDAPPATETAAEISERNWAARKAERERLEAENKAKRASLIQQTRANHESATRLLKSVFKNVQFVRPGETMRVGNGISLNVNQGRRDAMVRQISGDEALVEYWMPNGRSFFRIIRVSDHSLVRTVADPSTLPKRWKQTA